MNDPPSRLTSALADRYETERELGAHSGRELFHRSEGEELMSVPVTPSAATFVSGEPTPLFPLRDYVGFIYRRMYDVTPDDRRFVMLRRIVPHDNEVSVVVESFFEEPR